MTCSLEMSRSTNINQYILTISSSFFSAKIFPKCVTLLQVHVQS